MGMLDEPLQNEVWPTRSAADSGRRAIHWCGTRPHFAMGENYSSGVVRYSDGVLAHGVVDPKNWMIHLRFGERGPVDMTVAYGVLSPAIDPWEWEPVINPPDCNTFSVLDDVADDDVTR